MKRTCPAKTRIKTDIIEFFFQDDPCMDLASRLIWNLSPELQADKIQQKQFFCQIPKCSFEFLSFDNFFFSNHHVISGFAKETKNNYFSVKSSWEVHWMIMFQKDVVWITLNFKTFFLTMRIILLKISQNHNSLRIKKLHG